MILLHFNSNKSYVAVVSGDAFTYLMCVITDHSCYACMLVKLKCRYELNPFQCRN